MRRAHAIFGTLARVVTRRPLPVVMATLALTAFLVSGVASLRLDTSVESFLRRDDPVRLAYDQFRSRFGTDEVIRLGIRSRDALSLESLTRVRALHAELERELPYVEEVESLVSARFTHGTQDTLFVEDLFEDWPPDPDQLALRRDYARASPIYRNTLLSEDGRSTVITLRVAKHTASDEDALAGFEDDPVAGPTDGDPPAAEILRGTEVRELMEALAPIVARHQRPDFEIWVAGRIPMNFSFAQTLQRDLGRFAALSLVVIGAVLLALFRRVSRVLLPLLCVVLSLASTFGLMGHLGFPVTLMSQILPSFLLAVGVGAAIHLLSTFDLRLREGESREVALANALRHAGPPIVMTALTTAGSLLGFAFTRLAVVADFGLVAASGVMLTLVYCLVLLPSLLALTPVGSLRAAPGSAPTRPVRVLVGLGALGSHHPWPVVAGFAALTALALAGALQLRLSHSPLEWMPADHPYRHGFERTDRELGGAMTLELVLDTGASGGVEDPGFLASLDAFQGALRGFEAAGVQASNALGLADIAKETHRALHENRDAYYRVPEQAEVVAQELLLFENSGPDELERVVDSEFRRARVTLLVDYADALYYGPFLDTVAARFDQVIGERAALTATGLTFLAAASFEVLLDSLLRSYGAALAFLVPLMILFLRSLPLGLLSMLPNLLPILFALAFMHVAGIPLDVFTLLIGSIGIGIAVDDTIHFMHGFRREHARTGDPQLAVRTTLATTGRAMLVTSIVLIAGFLVFTAASMHNIVGFGIVTAVAVGSAFLCDVLLAPALVTLFVGRRPGPR